jgi:hypothetical protein
MENYFRRALKNISKHGDTDVFPYPLENSIFYDSEDSALDLLVKIHSNFSERLSVESPFNENQLTPVGYSGFRWCTQLDPIWNAYFLGLVISIGSQIEKQRIPIEEQSIFSYRFVGGEDDKIFDTDIGWRAFQSRSLELADLYETVIICDISDFYQRVRHHRLENALNKLENPGDTPSRINKFLGNYSGTYSHGLPVGGPAARLLSELLLNQTDKLLKYEGVKFCRFADDYHIFVSSEEEAFDALLLLSEKLLNNEGLSLQKSKTRIMSSSEFKNTSPLTIRESDGEENISAQAFLSLSLRFDPYSHTAEDDYETLKSEIEKFDIIGLLRKEVAKNKIDIAVTRQIVKSLKFISDPTRDQAVLSICNSLHNLYPIFPTVILVIKQIWPELSEDTRRCAHDCIHSLFKEDSRLIKTDVNKAYVCRLLSCQETPENIDLLCSLFVKTKSMIIKRDIVLIMFNWRNWAWISDLRSQFSNFSPPLRRAFIVGSYSLGDEGKHWRQHNKAGFSDLEKITHNWSSSKADKNQGKEWQVPL